MNDALVRRVAMLNLEKLSKNPYPGRGIIIGTNENGKCAVQVYWIMGRGETSRNRVFKYDAGRLFTEPADPAKVKNPNDLALIIYNAMGECCINGNYVVSNGDQTDTVMNRFKHEPGASLQDILRSRQYEPDAPNSTSRITGLCRLQHGECHTELSLLRRSELVGKDQCARSYYEYTNILPGGGFCVHTYAGDGDPLPQFDGEPYPLPLYGDIGQIASTYWETLNRANKVSIAVKFIDLETGKSEIAILNKLIQVPKKVEEASAVQA